MQEHRTAGTLLTRLERTAVMPERIGTLARSSRPTAASDVGREHLLLETGDDDEQADEHDEERPVDVEIDLLRLDPAGEEKKRAAEDGDLGDRLAGEEQRDHRDRDRTPI